MPVPSAFDTASFAAKRAAKHRAGSLRCAVRLLGGEKQPVEKRLPAPLHRSCEARDLHDVHAEAEHAHGRAFIAASISRTAPSSPLKIARDTMLWPMFSSARCGTVRMSAMFA